MRRREFIALIGGASVVWPLAARAQQNERVRHVAVLNNLAEDDPAGQADLASFARALQQLGWTDGHNVQIERRWGAGDVDRIRKNVTDLVALEPDVIVAGGASMGLLMQATRTVPIVFVVLADPVGAGFVESLARPGGNATGFTTLEYAMSGKWLELLKEIAPETAQVAVVRDTASGSGPAQFGAIQAVAGPLGVELKPVAVGDAAEIERGITSVARASHGGLIVTQSPYAAFHRDLIVTLVAAHKLPAVYFFRSFVADGGLISYGPDFVDEYRQAAGYVDRILKGEKPADLPVQAPTKYELVVNLKTAKALSLTIPSSVLARADEVIE
jgi:putative tryptophan/tyrosine transport system substrate-binding protein